MDCGKLTSNDDELRELMRKEEGNMTKVNVRRSEGKRGEKKKKRAIMMAMLLRTTIDVCAAANTTHTMMIIARPSYDKARRSRQLINNHETQQHENERERHAHDGLHQCLAVYKTCNPLRPTI